MKTTSKLVTTLQIQTNNMRSSHDQPSTSKVSFAPSATLRLARHLSEYTPEELEASYYSRRDFASFKEDVRRTLRMMEMKQRVDDEQLYSSSEADNFVYCTRGADAYTRQAIRIKSNTRRAATLAVMDAFDDAYHVSSSTEVAAAYTSISIASATAAHMVGLSDELAVLTEEQQKESPPSSSKRKNIVVVPSTTGTIGQKPGRIQQLWVQKTRKNDTAKMSTAFSRNFSRMMNVSSSSSSSTVRRRNNMISTL